MPLYGGIDLHANNSVIVLLNEQDEVIYRKRLSNDLPAILEQLAPCHAEMKGLVVESTYNWYWLVNGLKDNCYLYATSRCRTSLCEISSGLTSFTT
jgi:hypothetical protein